MRQAIKDAQSRAIDGFSFGFINALQLRGKAGSHTVEEMQAYVEQCESISLEEFYRIPDNYVGGNLPTSGTFTWPSPILSGCPENDRMHLNIWLGPQGWKSPVMFLLHGVMSVSDVGYRMWAKKLNALGWSAIFFHLPYHYGRKPRQALSGEMALTSNLIRTSEGIRQAVVELRWVCRALKIKGVPHIGLWGTSYGGWISSLLCTLEDSISTAWLLEPIVDTDIAIWESPATHTLQRQLKKRGIPRDLVRRHLRLVCPTYHQPRLDPARIMLVGGTFDRIAPPQTIKALQQAWQGSHYDEFRQGHVGYQLMPKSLKLARARFPELFSQ
jgi:pimeloyl-ACP methyl ester carboxylesterase